MKIELITYAIDLAALAKKPPPGGRGGTAAPALPWGETGVRDDQCNRPAPYGTMGSGPSLACNRSLRRVQSLGPRCDSPLVAPGIS